MMTAPSLCDSRDLQNLVAFPLTDWIRGESKSDSNLNYMFITFSFSQPTFCLPKPIAIYYLSLKLLCGMCMIVLVRKLKFSTNKQFQNPN